MAGTKVYVEVGARRTFACALDWPGWARSGKTPELAVETLAAYAPRYRAVADEAGVRFPRNVADGFDVIERIAGDATTDFGAPGKVARADHDPLSEAQAKRLASFVTASWEVLNRAARGAPESLRKGPRGGGRDRDAVVQHVLSAESSYARMLGIKHREPRLGDSKAIRALRDDLITALRAARAAEVPGHKWPARYAARRIAWHAIDHAWEIEDRSD